MKQTSSALTFNDVLNEAKSLQREFEAQKEPTDIGPEPEGVRRFQEAMKARLTSEHGRRSIRLARGDPDFSALSFDEQMWLTLEGMRERRMAPFYYSELCSYLELETWTPRDALLILAGVQPEAAQVDWEYDNFLGAKIDKPKIRRATWFADVGDHYDWPLVREMSSPSEISSQMKIARATGDAERIRLLEAELSDYERWANDPTSKYLQEMLALRSEMLHQLARLWFSADHDPTARRTPVFFVRWAESRGFEIEWAAWAREHGHLEHEPPITEPPYFDADAEDYPRLLHIAVRAWEHARKSTDAGTAKQRIAAFLESRYPDLSTSERDAIALIGNWQKQGGRPKKGG